MSDRDPRSDTARSGTRGAGAEPPASGPYGGEPAAAEPGRRRFLGYLIAAPVLVMGIKLGVDTADAPPAEAAEAAGQVIITPPLPADVIDLGDILILAAAPTADMLTLTVNPDGSVTFLLPCEEVGQGITTSIAMLIADEMNIALSQVTIELQPATPSLVFNQLTGGPNTIRSLYTPVRTVAAAAKGRLLAAAAARLGADARALSVSRGVVRAPDGQTAGYGALSAAAADPKLVSGHPELKPARAMTIVGTPTPRIAALEMVTGAKKYALDPQPSDRSSSTGGKSR